jgi:hypothetical protein
MGNKTTYKTHQLCSVRKCKKTFVLSGDLLHVKCAGTLRRQWMVFHATILLKGITCTSCRSTLESVPCKLFLVFKELQLRWLLKRQRSIMIVGLLLPANLSMQWNKLALWSNILITTGEDRSRIDLILDGVLIERLTMILKSSIQALPGVWKT